MASIQTINNGETGEDVRGKINNNFNSVNAGLSTETADRVSADNNLYYQIVGESNARLEADTNIINMVNEKIDISQKGSANGVAGLNNNRNYFNKSADRLILPEEFGALNFNTYYINETDPYIIRVNHTGRGKAFVILPDETSVDEGTEYTIISYNTFYGENEQLGVGSGNSNCTVTLFGVDSTSYFNFDDGGDSVTFKLINSNWYAINTKRCVRITDEIIEGNDNLFFTTERVDDAISSQKNVANGIAGLDANIKILTSQLPLSIKAGTADGSTIENDTVNNTATGICSHSEGEENDATGECAHAEGAQNLASGDYSHAEGGASTSSGDGSHAEGGITNATGTYAHSEGTYTFANGGYSHAEGNSCISDGYSSHANGDHTLSKGVASHAEGVHSIARLSAEYAHSSTSNGQYRRFFLYIQTTGATPSELLNYGTNPRIIVESGKRYRFLISVFCANSDTSIYGDFEVRGIIKRPSNEASTAIVGTNILTVVQRSSANLTVSATADTTNGSLSIKATGLSSTTINWGCKLEIIEI